MAHTVTLLADHKGYTKPRVNGDEYMVDALIDISTYNLPLGETVTATSLGLKRLTQVHLAGDEALTFHPFIQITSSGNYCDYAAGPPVVFEDSQFTLKLSVGDADPAGGINGTDTGSIRIRAYGIL